MRPPTPSLLLSILATTLTAAAIPLEILLNLGDPSICANCMSCTATDHFLWVTYDAHIGAPYSSATCDFARALMQEKAWWIIGPDCHDDGKGMIKFGFHALHDNQDALNLALAEAFPEVQAVNPFNCPPY